jgi:hypothetical protein
MIRSYDLACALKILIGLLETNDEHSIAPYCNEETEMLKELYRAIPRPNAKMNEKEFLDAINSFYHAYTVVVGKTCLEAEDIDTIQSFLDKLSQKIKGLEYFLKQESSAAKPARTA